MRAACTPVAKTNAQALRVRGGRALKYLDELKVELAQQLLAKVTGGTRFKLSKS